MKYNGTKVVHREILATYLILVTGKLSEAYHFVLGYSYGLDKGAE